MKYTFKCYYQKDTGMPYELIPLNTLHEYIGYAIADRIIDKVAYRMIDKTLPEVIAFFKIGGTAVVGKDLTNRGNVFIEAVEVED